MTRPAGRGTEGAVVVLGGGGVAAEPLVSAHPNPASAAVTVSGAAASGAPGLHRSGADEATGAVTMRGEDGGSEERARSKKAPNAFRTISEVADELHIPQHVLRFWETRFPTVRPLKRGGGRRYYRPDDIALLRRISDLLYTQGYTIKGVQRLLREGGGRLSDDIPPATPGERAEAAAERVATPPDDLAPGVAVSAVAARDVAVGAPLRPEPGEIQSDVALHALLHRVLRELQALRGLLP